MGRKELAVFGGLLSGIGQGMIAQDTKRMEEEKTKRLEIIAGLKLDNSGMSAGDKRLWDTTVASKTTEGIAGSTTDWDAITKLFEKSGRLDLAEISRQTAKPLDVNSDEYLAAEEAADAWINAQAGWFSTDSSDFKEYGGNREQARQAKIREFLPGGRTQWPHAGKCRRSLCLHPGALPHSAGTESGNQRQMGLYPAHSPLGSRRRVPPLCVPKLFTQNTRCLCLGYPTVLVCLSNVLGGRVFT